MARDRQQREDQFVENFMREAFNENYNPVHPVASVTTSGIEPGVTSLTETSFSGDEDEENGGTLGEDIRKMAQALAPQMSELEDVLKDFSQTDTDEMGKEDVSRSMVVDEDDDMDDELTQLAISEQALREELEFAAGMSLLGSPGKVDNPHFDHPSPVVLNAPSEQSNAELSTDGDPSASYTLQDHADFMKIQTERMGGWYYCDMSAKLLPSSSAQAPGLVKDYCLPIPFRKLKRLYSGLVFHDVVQHVKQPPMTPIRSVVKSSSETTQMTPSTPVAKAQAPTAAASETQSASAAPPSTPQTPAQGVPPPPPPPPPPPTPGEEPLPVRTVAIRVRPDVLCGAVMDAVHHAFEILPKMCTTHVLKRQGGHLRGAVYNPDKQIAYVVDIQLCTQRNDDLERRLIVRFYHCQDDEEALLELGQILQQNQQCVPPSPQVVDREILGAASGNSIAIPANQSDLSSLSSTTGYAAKMMGAVVEENELLAKERAAANRHMKQACSLVQRLMAAQQQGGVKTLDIQKQKAWLGMGDGPYDSKGTMQEMIGNHLESNYKACPSVREENKKASPTIRRLTLPSLSAKDWPLLDASWTLTRHIVDELDTRDCTYNTLGTLPFGQFPSLPTLDVQYCSQLRRLSRENMITHLLKSAKELEDYATLAEYNCAVCITLLVPMLEFYGIPAPALPKAKALDEYPLDYVPPQQTCPPWGNLVMEALNQIAAKTPTGEINVEDAILLVYQAFTKQDDEEQGARLQRKNIQIMDRLANMQSHQKTLIQKIKDSHMESRQATESASIFLKSAQRAYNVGKDGYPSVLREEVPLLDFKISLGASKSGRCYITTRSILFTTTYIPILRSTSSILFDLSKVTFEVEENPTSSLLNPFPNTMNVVLKSSQQVVYSFRPAIGPDRLKTFVTIIQGLSDESSPSEYSQVVNDAQVVENRGVVAPDETQSEESYLI